MHRAFAHPAWPCLAALAVAQPVGALELGDALALARAHATEFAAVDADRERAAAEAAAIDEAYDPTLYSTAQFAHDRSEQQSVFAGEWRNRFDGEVGLRRLLPSATAIAGGAGFTSARTHYPPAAAPVPGQPPAFDPAGFQSANPAYTAYLSVSARQPLLRNAMGRELKLRRDLAATATLAPDAERRLRNQHVQAETEQLYWTLAALHERVALTQAILTLSREFAEKMRARVLLGRADHVDVAAADAAVVAQEGALLEMQLAADQVRRRLRLRLYPAQATATVAVDPPADVLAHPSLPLPATTTSAALAYADTHRADLELLERSRRPLMLRRDLVDEERRPELDAFASLRASGLEPYPETALVDPLNDGKHWTLAVGVEAALPLRHSGRDARRRALAAEQVSLSAQAVAIRAYVFSEVELALTQQRAAAEQLAQAERAAAVLERKRSAEAAKFAQARSEEVVVLRYALEALAAQADRVAALEAARFAEARLRLALHAYPEADRP